MQLDENVLCFGVAVRVAPPQLDHARDARGT